VLRRPGTRFWHRDFDPIAKPSAATILRGGLTVHMSRAPRPHRTHWSGGTPPNTRPWPLPWRCAQMCDSPPSSGPASNEGGSGLQLKRFHPPLCETDHARPRCPDMLELTRTFGPAASRSGCPALASMKRVVGLVNILRSHE